MGKVWGVLVLALVALVVAVGVGIGVGRSWAPAPSSEAASSASQVPSEVSPSEGGVVSEGTQGATSTQAVEPGGAGEGFTPRQIERIEDALRRCMMRENSAVHYVSWAGACLRGTDASWEPRKGEPRYE